ncbi:MAG: class II aldolase/adducin family protein [Granulosicoccus sp.]
MTENQIRKKIIALCLRMNATGLNQGTSGNISARYNDHMLITPSGIPYEELKPADIAKMKIEGDDFVWKGPSRPSSEWHFHRAILKAKPDVHAIVHTHSTFSTVVSIAREDIPACHYMIAAFGGNSVRCAEYETFGTAELSASMLRAMKDRTACLLSNHGMVAGGKNLDNAMWAAVELETLSRQYYYAKLAGNMVILPEDEMARVLEKFKTYGQVQKPAVKNRRKTSARMKSSDASATQASAGKVAAKKTAKKATTKKAAAGGVAVKKSIAKKVASKKASSGKKTRTARVKM